MRRRRTPTQAAATRERAHDEAAGVEHERLPAAGRVPAPEREEGAGCETCGGTLQVVHRGVGITGLRCVNGCGLADAAAAAGYVPLTRR